ncbi:Uncharacterized protein ALO78_02317 [Pseudomonas amygdali pv. ciccaronei]|nr:Uncharacterized protein ALO78_02317 [Pseudomonas amygdali pv. ciccaronei]
MRDKPRLAASSGAEGFPIGLVLQGQSGNQTALLGVPMTETKQQPPAKSSNVHVGFGRYAALTKTAIDASYQTGQQITTSQVAQYLVDNYLEAAYTALINERQK